MMPLPPCHPRCCRPEAAPRLEPGRARANPWGHRCGSSPGINHGLSVAQSPELVLCTMRVRINVNQHVNTILVAQSQDPMKEILGWPAGAMCWPSHCPSTWALGDNTVDMNLGAPQDIWSTPHAC